MPRKRLPPAQQGGPDGLCGFYSLINFIHNLDKFREPSEAETNQEAFRYLAEAAEQLGLLTAHHLSCGFEWPKLRAIFNKMAGDWCLDVTALPLAAVGNHLKSFDFVKVAQAVLQEGGALVAHMRPGHWVLVYGADDKGFFIDDSELSEVEIAQPLHMTFDEVKRRFDTANVGLALVPNNSSFADLQ